VEMYRQGDVLIVKDKIPQRVKMTDRRTSRVLVYGEATGHSHKLEGEAVMIYGANQAEYFAVAGEAKLVHEEHDTITLPEGEYRVVRQREFDEEQIRYVAD